MINLFIIIHDFSGVKTYIDELSGYLIKEKDISVFQLHLNYKDLKEFRVQTKDKITSVYVPEKVNKVYDPKYYRRAAQIVYSHFQSIKNVVFHANMPEHYLFTKEIKVLFQCRIVFTFHFLMSYYSYNERIFGCNNVGSDKGDVLEKFMLEASDQVICVTQFAQRAITSLHKIPTSKTNVIYNGKSFPKELQKQINSDKTHYGFLPEDRIILFAGPLEPRKGIDKLIEAFLLIKDKFPTLKLVIAGSGGYNSYLPIAQGCIGRICFTGRLNKSTLFDFYRFSEIGVIPSRYEQCSYVAIEMMQISLPLIISDVPGLNELIRHGENGLVCKTKQSSTMEDTIEVDQTDLALQMEYLLKNKQVGLNLAKASHFQSIERHSLDNMGKTTLNIYRQLFYSKKI